MGFRDYVLKYCTAFLILTGGGIVFWLFWYRLISPFLFHMNLEVFLRYLKPTSSDRFVNSMLSYILSSEHEITLKEWEELCMFYPNRRKTPSFSYGDIRRVLRSPRRAEEGRFFLAWRKSMIQYAYTVGHTEIHAWGNRARRQFFGGGAVVVEPRIPCL